MKVGIGNPVPQQVADMSMQMFSPKREVVVDMVMVQQDIVLRNGAMIYRK